MAKLIVLALVLLTSIAAQAQMGGGMMGGGMRNQGQVDASGAEIFRRNCASCHVNGGNVVTPDLPLRGSRMLADFETFLAFIRHPHMPDGSQGAMPAYTESRIPDAQAERLYRFVTAADRSGESRN